MIFLLKFKELNLFFVLENHFKICLMNKITTINNNNKKKLKGNKINL